MEGNAIFTSSRPWQIRWSYEVSSYTVLQHSVGLLPNENSNFENDPINYLIACRKTDLEAFLISTVIASDPEASFASHGITRQITPGGFLILNTT